MKKLITQIACILVVLSTSIVQAQQVGVNTNDPKATFQVVGQPGTNTIADGIIPPKITRAQLTAKNAVYTSSQSGALVYVTALDGSATGKTINVTSLGYFYFDGTVWVAMLVPNDVIQERMYSGNVISGNTGDGFNDRTFTAPMFFPKSTSSTLVIEIDGDYQISGSGSDTYTIEILVNGTIINTKAQRFWGGSTGTGTRSTVLLPMMIDYQNTSLTPKTISYRIRQNSSDDNVILWNKYVKITELVKYDNSSNGTAIIANYYGTSACTGTTGTINGDMGKSIPVNGVTMSLYANVTTPGTYNISTNTQNGVSFYGSGTLTSTGCQLITLTAIGTPASMGSFTWATATSPSISATAIVHCDATFLAEVTNPGTGKIWMDRNLGASQVATSSTDAASYGSHYQWGRLRDEHQCSSAGTTTTLSSSDVPGHSNFILTSSSPFDWRSPQNNSLWQGVSGINNPCPSGYRVPTSAEYAAEQATWSANNSTGAFASPLKFPVAGVRLRTTGGYDGAGIYGSYWTSNVSGVLGGSTSMNITISTANSNGNSTPSAGFSVRCIKD